MQNQKTDFDEVMMSVMGEQDAGTQIARDNGRKRNAVAHRGPGEKLANLGIFLGISLMTSVAFVTQWTPAGIEPSRLWVHAVVALALAQLAIISGISFKSTGRSKRATPKQRPARFAKTERRVEPRLPAPSQPAPAAPKVESAPVSTGLLSGKQYILFSDGSCEIDTMFGRRRFEDIDAARVFVGG